MDEDLAASPQRPNGDLPAAPAAPPGGAPNRHRHAPWFAGIVALLVVAALVAAAFIRVPYVIISPGNATRLDDAVLRVTGAPTYLHRGDMLFLTVAVSNRDPNLYRYLFARLDGDTAVEQRKSVIGCAGYAESGRLARTQMDQSQDAAKAVALRRLGYEVPALPSRVQVIDVLCDGPSDGAVQLGDVIVAVDGTAVTTAAQVRPLILAHRPGDTVELTVERNGRRRTVSVELGERDGAAFAGIVSDTDIRHEIPVDVTIDTARVSGPSAGLAFSLAIIDDLTPGDLTGGGDVAVTGTILEDGRVGPVGGVAQKAVAARRAGARLMIVPADEAQEARAHFGSKRVVGVRTLDGALRALVDAGGAPLPDPLPSIVAPGRSAQ